ncbi:cytochrome P450 [Rhizoctonia solani]|nr:cytochrome P450 [Rhizoctonia solani]
MDSKSWYTGLAISSLACVGHYWFRCYKQKLRHPPSPKSLPLVGNIFSIPAGLDHFAYMELGKQLNMNIGLTQMHAGDMVYLNMMGQPCLILNSAQAAADLLDKRSAKYSDRVSLPMFKDPTLLDWSGFMGLLPYNDVWRHQRRRMNNWLNARAVRQFNHLQQDEARLLLGHLLDISESQQLFEKGKHHAMGSAAFKLGYGYRLKDDQDPFFLNAVQAMNHFFEAAMMGNFLVNMFPSLIYIPDWFPGTGWKRTARKWREENNLAVDAPYEWTKRQATGNFEPSVLSALLQDHQLLKELAFIIVAGKSNLMKYRPWNQMSATGLVNFIAAMVTNPEVQAIAQAEIDSVIGYATRLPTISDEARLPYIRNLILEVLRWQHVGPTGGAPHACYEDDVYRGYNIQKGTIVFLNRAMTRDETVYENPEGFQPDRFCDPNVPPAPGFGWGRRKCPGIHFAEASLFLIISSLLTTFTISRKKDKDGNEIIPRVESASNSVAV